MPVCTQRWAIAEDRGGAKRTRVVAELGWPAYLAPDEMMNMPAFGPLDGDSDRLVVPRWIFPILHGHGHVGRVVGEWPHQRANRIFRVDFEMTVDVDHDIVIVETVELVHVTGQTLGA